MALDYTTFELPNGLRVVHCELPESSMVAVNVLYNVGARDDSEGLTGMAHLHEHLMFGGSVNIADFDGALELAGGSNNAWTSDDFTSYWDLVPAQNAETAFWLESDRMLSLAFSPRSLEVQRQVVIEEFKQVCLNRPYGDLSHRIREMMFTRHPYRCPTIGSTPADIERITMDDVRRFFFSHYAPNNAVLSVAGRITADRCRRLAGKWFGALPRREIAPRIVVEEPVATAPLRRAVKADVPKTLLAVIFPMGGYTDPHYIGADLLTDILANGRSSRFYRRLLIATDLFTDVDASISGLEETGYLMVTATLREHGDNAVADAEKALWTELDSIVAEPPTPGEVQRVVNAYESTQALTNLNSLAIAQNLAMATMHGESPEARLERYLEATPATIHAAARAIIVKQCARTLIYG